ncbi:DUF6493 family protein [Actinomadura napierensis]|uniref:Secreted protein n=1 Tax=Actinomadura napierensis TaxID=267854 RepID=A0ABN2ZF88_9ACTN
MTSTAWQEVAALIDARKADAVAGAVLALDAAGRRAVAEALPGHVREVRSRREIWEGIDEFAPAFRAAGAGALGSASAVASWLTRRELTPRRRGGHHDTARLMRLWEGRDDAWLADLARRLTLRLRGPRHVGLDLVLALLAESGIEPPDHDPLITGWVSSLMPRKNDPLRPHLLPRIFEVEGAGRILRNRGSWLAVLAQSAERGEVDREMLLDGCVRRFLRGGTDLDLRFFVRLHERLAPSDAEIRARARDYVRLLPAAPGPVAELALGLLTERDDLPPELVTEALDGVLFRAEARLVRPGLAWLERTVRRRPELADGCASALARAFEHESYAVQQRAVRVALKLPDTTDGTPLRDAMPLLPSDLAAQITARFGGEVPEPEAVDEDPPPVLLASAGARSEPVPSLASPITTPEELAGAFHHGYSDRSAAAEQVLAALVRLAWKDRDAVRNALESVIRTDSPRHLRQSMSWSGTWEWLNGIGLVLTSAVLVPEDGDERLPHGQVSVPRILFLRRFAEVYDSLRAGTLPPVLLATATRPTGHLDPGVLVERLEICEAAGTEPGTADLQHALLRLPPEIDPEAVRRASRLTSAAGGEVARRLAEGGLPVPGAGASALRGSGIEVVVKAEVTGRPVIDEVFSVPPTDDRTIDGWQVPFWSWLLPSHPQMVAVHLVPKLVEGAPVSALIELVPGDGPFAEAVAYFLARELVGERAAGPLLTLAGRGDLPAAALGRHIGRLALAGEIKLVRVVEALEGAAEAGAYAQVWDVIAAALPVLHPEPGRRSLFAHDRLIALGTRTARWAKASGPIPEIDELAGRKGSSNVIRAARALAAQLG